jgi:hypothetical protein
MQKECVELLSTQTRTRGARKHAVIEFRHGTLAEHNFHIPKLRQSQNPWSLLRQVPPKLAVKLKESANLDTETEVLAAVIMKSAILTGCKIVNTTDVSKQRTASIFRVNK